LTLRIKTRGSLAGRGVAAATGKMGLCPAGCGQLPTHSMPPLKRWQAVGASPQTVPLAAKAEGPDHSGPSMFSVFRGLPGKGKGCAPGRHILPPAGGPVYALALDGQPRS